MKKILFVTRGRGAGHAVPDLAIAAELRRRLPSAELSFISYGTGASVLRRAGHEVVDLGLSEATEMWDVLRGVHHICGRIRPDLVVAHEEPAGVMAANLLGIRSMYIAAWIASPADHSFWPHVDRFMWAMYADALKAADEICILERDGIFVSPEFLVHKTSCTGPVVGGPGVKTYDRGDARRRLSLHDDEVAVAVISGGLGEEREPSAAKVLAAFDMLPLPATRLVWASGRDMDCVSQAAEGRRGVTVLGSRDTVADVMAAADVGVTKGSYCATREFAAVGCPLVCLSFGNNWMDEYLLRMTTPAVWIAMAAANPGGLRDAILAAMGRGWRAPAIDELSKGVTHVVRRIELNIGSCL